MDGGCGMLMVTGKYQQGGGRMIPNMLLGALAVILVVVGIVSRVKK